MNIIGNHLEYTVISSSKDQEISGSIIKIQSLGNTTGSLSRIEFGKHRGSLPWTASSIISTAIEIPVNGVIEGGVGRAKVNSGPTAANPTGGGFLFYLIK